MNLPLNIMALKPRRDDRRGVALVLVLAGLVLITAVTVAFLIAMRTESVAARSYSDAVYVRLLGDAGVELVKNQILVGTTQTNTAWASQPGAIRTFGTDGNLARVYRLYSSQALIDSTFTPVSGGEPAEVPTGWKSLPNEFTDLNAPVVGGVETFYPILNPSVFSSGVQGMSVSGSWLTSATGTPGTETYRPAELPMPVQWLYQLKNGEWAAMDQATKKVANATAANPIVGRVAFWADDETCKININTAGAVREGDGTKMTFWDIPRGGLAWAPSPFEPNLGYRQPAQREYQRYPGHPARVALNSVFPQPPDAGALTASELYDVTPRVNSQDATIGSDGGSRIPDSLLPLKSTRLYASLDELQFDPTRAVNNTKITPQRLNELQFLLTAYNRAPDLNLFGKPRVSMWPAATDPTKRTPIDKWFVRCATIGDKTFSVTRSNSNSPTEDLTTSGATIPFLFKYLQDQTTNPIPGYGGSFASKYGSSGRDQLLTLSLDYIRCVNLYDSSVSTGTAGFFLKIDSGGNYSYPPAPLNANAFTPGIQGYRSSPNHQVSDFPGFGQAVPLRVSPANVPTSSGAFKGLGRMDTTISEAGFWVWALQWDDGTPVREDDVVTILGVDYVVGTYFTQPSRMIELASTAGVSNPKTPGVGAPMYASMFVISPFNPMAGFVKYNPNYLIEVESGLGAIQLNGSNVFPKDTGVNWVRLGFITGVGGGTRGFWDTLRYGFAGGKTPFYANATVLNPNERDYPFHSVVFPVPAAQNGIPFSGGTIKVNLRTKNEKPSESSEILQQLTFNFPSTTLAKPLPSMPAVTSNEDNTGEGNAIKNRRRLRSIGNYNDNANTFVEAGDVLVSMEASGAGTDFRWLSLQDTADSFLKHKDYDSTASSKLIASGLRQWPFPLLNRGPSALATSGNFVKDAHRVRPVISSRFEDGVLNNQGKPGDWDNGFGDLPAVAYAGKPDEGVIRYGLGANNPPYYISAWGNIAYASEQTYFAPNRQVPSPGVMGSLPSRARESNGGWETLLFCPNPSAGSTVAEHRGFASPPDYLWMDLFTMPIVEPYAISEPFSTAGKLNMNYQIVPFTYINRNTHLRAAFAANRIAAITPAQATNPFANVNIRYPIHGDETLKQFQAKFDNNQIFKSATEICSMWLYPANQSNSAQSLVTDSPGSNTGIKNWWYDSKSATGDNLREQPYMALYQNLTTQSNTFTVYVKVQTIKKVPGTPDDQMTDRDQVTGEYQAATLIERYMDPNIATFDETKPVTGFKFRTISSKQFVP